MSKILKVQSKSLLIVIPAVITCVVQVFIPYSRYDESNELGVEVVTKNKNNVLFKQWDKINKHNFIVKPKPIIHRVKQTKQKRFDIRTLRLTLIGTIVEGNHSYAVIKDSSGKIKLYKVGEEIRNMRLTEIGSERVTLMLSGQSYQLDRLKNKKQQ